MFALPAVAQPAAPSLQNLVANSPFGMPAQPGMTPASNAPLEFRGTFVDSGERFFSIVDSATRRGEWVAMNESGRAFQVKSYNPETETISVEYQGRSLDLKLHSARVAALPVQPVVQNQPATGPNQPGRAAVTNPTTNEAQRLAQVAEEIRRRRALRQQAAQQQAAQPPTSNQPPR